MKKSNKAEVERRIKSIYKLLVSGYTHTEIVSYCSQNYGVSNTIAKRYINKALKKIIENNNNDIEILRAEATTRYLSWIRKAESKEDYKTAAYLQSRIDKINGLEIQIQKLEHTGNISLNVDMNNLIKKYKEQYGDD